MTPEQLHAFYVSLTGLPVPFTMERNFIWEVWVSKGFCADDLKLVVAHYRRTVEKKTILMRMLGFNRFVRDTSRFEEDLAEARACARGRNTASGIRNPESGIATSPAGARALASASPEQAVCKPVAAVIKGIEPGSRWTLSPESLAEWNRMKEGLK